MPSSAARRMSSRSFSVSAARRDAAALAIDALAVGELAARAHHGRDARAGHLFDLQHDLAVVEQQRVAGVHVLGQFLVGAADLVAGAGLRIERGIERERRAFGQLHRAVAETLDADLRTGQIASRPM